MLEWCVPRGSVFMLTVAGFDGSMSSSAGQVVDSFVGLTRRRVVWRVAGVVLTASLLPWYSAEVVSSMHLQKCRRQQG